MTGKLPIVAVPHDTFTFSDGQTIGIRGLSRAEAIMARIKGQDDDENLGATNAEVYIIQCTVDVTEAEASAWHGVTPSGDVERLVDKVAALSGLKADEGKDDAEHSPSAKPTVSTTS